MNSLSAKPGPASPSPGLTAAEVATRLSQFGPNAVREERPHPVRQFLERFWAPISWLLEATISIQLFFGEQVMRDHVRLLGSVFVRVCGAGKRTV